MMSSPGLDAFVVDLEVGPFKFHRRQSHEWESSINVRNTTIKLPAMMKVHPVNLLSPRMPPR